jgi:hypothetical protein
MNPEIAQLVLLIDATEKEAMDAFMRGDTNAEKAANRRSNALRRELQNLRGEKQLVRRVKPPTPA